MSIYMITSMTEGVWFNKCEFKGNCAQYGHGGGISCYIDGGDGSENDRVVFRDTDFLYNCQSSNNEKHGGGMFHRDTRRRVDMYNCNFTNNYAHGLTAGGAGISTEGHLLLDNCNFNGNMADNSFGGALYCRPWTYESDNIKRLFVEIKGGSFTNNNCTWTEDLNSPHTDLHRGSGGAIYVSIHRLPGDTLATYDYIINLKIQDNCLIANNHADRNGGAINISGTTYMQEYLDAGNEITSDLEINSAIIHDNNTGKSGAAWTPAGSEHDDGGAVYLSYTNLKMTGSNSQVKVYDNTALKNGGAFCLQKGNITMDGGTLGMEGHPNHAVLGGGFYVFQGSVTMNNGLIGFNQASSNGGGGYVDAGGSVLMEGGEIHDNTAINGGGMFVNGGSFTLDGGYIHGNDATTYGGGVYMNGGDFLHYRGEVGKSYDNPNTAVNGAGVYMNGGNYTMTAGYINGNAAGSNGGGVYMNSGDFNMKGGTIGWGSTSLRNTAVDGAGVYMYGGEFTMKSGYMRGNYATRNGGAVYSAGGTIDVKGGYIGQNNNSHNEAVNGGGIYSAGGVVTLDNDSTAVYVNYNKAVNGGGIYTTSGGSITIDKTVPGRAVELRGNEATNYGGGVFAGGAITISGGNVLMNKGVVRGGGVYVDGGTFDFNDGVIGGTTAEGNATTGSGSTGGGLFMNSGTANIMGGSLSGNRTDGAGMGGGVYMNGGTCILSNGATVGGATDAYANSAMHGGGIYSAGGTITVKGGKIQRNTAVAGGGIYTNGSGGVVNMEKQTSKAEALSYIEYNTAEEGGGIYANRGVVNFSDGYIQYNYASNAGGGMYVNDNGGNDYGTLNLKGSANLRRNHVPAGHNGGGVYLKGMVVVGEQTADLGRIMAQENYAGDEYVYEWNDTGHPETDSIDQVTANNRNNIYLPHPEDTLVLTTHRDVITVIEDGISLTSRVGFSVPRNYVPVIYCALSDSIIPETTTDTAYWGWHSSHKYLNQFSTGHEYQYLVFDDTRHYVAVHYPDKPALFDPDHVYLYGFWANVVTGNEFDLECPITAADFEGQDPIEISNACELAFFISWVNGLNGLDTHAGANAKLVADIDMSKYGWVPIGDLANGYSGTFDGNGHTVTGVNSLLYREYQDYGFFGRLDGGTVKDLFVKDASYALDNMPDLVIGGLVGEITTASTVSNCEASSRITATNTTTVVGGLIGRMNAGTVHSAIGISDMKGYLMGGLVGELLGGNLYNSFSNCRYTKAENHEKYMGGLVAVNRGTVENCYARLRGSVPKGKFGILVGDNTDGTVSCCYAPAGMTNYKAAGASPTGHGNYGDSYLPYLYGHRDTQVSLVESTNAYVPTGEGADKQMMNVLNEWVRVKNGNTSTYTRWSRPWQESNTLKPINDDLPILKMPMCEAVGAKNGDPYLYYNTVDSLLVWYTDAESAIWLYSNPSDVVRGDNGVSASKLYIAEDVVLKNLNALKAYVGITLDNSAGGQGANPTYGEMLGVTTDATDWHMISSPLMDAPIGINYSDNGSYDFSWGHPDGMPYYLFFQKGNARNGYFPSHRFGENYPTTDATIEAGSYYNEWDFYAYSEPNYHWINFKRNSNSHRHFDTETHEPISYGNEPSLIPGKGYFAATREETFLQCQGNLNADEVTIGLTMTTGVPRHGYNLIGNPYQAYLDFDAFAEANWGDDVDVIWGQGETPSYTILDEDAASYLTFAYDGSDNPDAAGRFIHPHQGFFVRTGLNGSMAYFLPDMRNTTARNSSFRSNDHIDYPLVNLFVSEANGNSDMVTVELGRPTQGGALLMQGLRAGNGKIWCHYNDVDYAVAYTQPGVTEAAIRFETVADTEYTMRWNTHNGDFSYLHLIDNVTGADVDCLTTDEYRFSANTSDYKSRFRLVFGYTGLEEDTEADANESFAFMMGDELVVTGEGALQVFDVTGRMIANQELHGVQTTVSLPNAANGVYVLRLTEGKQSRIQKMVISK